ncbi:MAG: YqgE/AlgH family protein [Geminicoccales bacterium]
MVKLLRNLVATMFLGLLGSPIAQAAEQDFLSIDRYSPPLTGKYLVASPELTDPNFHHAVIYVVHHDDQGTMGLVINQLMAEGPVGKLLEAFGIEGDPSSQAQVKMHFGGPVDPGSSLVLHRNDYKNDTTTEIGNHLALSSSDDVLADLALNQGPDESLLILGYAGWGANQLEDEITSGAWYVVDAEDTLLFDDDMTTKWQRAMALRGFEL